MRETISALLKENTELRMELSDLRQKRWADEWAIRRWKIGVVAAYVIGFLNAVLWVAIWHKYSGR